MAEVPETEDSGDYIAEEDLIEEKEEGEDNEGEDNDSI